jgi:hypothetical protein
MTASAPWRDIRPELSAEPYVFAAGEPPPGLTPFAVIREDEGVTLVLTGPTRTGPGWTTTTSRRGSRCAWALRSPTSA